MGAFCCLLDFVHAYQHLVGETNGGAEENGTLQPSVLLGIDLKGGNGGEIHVLRVNYFACGCVGGVLGSNAADACVVDTDHPNDLGFYRMAEAMYPYLKRLLESYIW